MHEPALSQRLDTLWRMESPVLIARLARLLGGDVGRAEELAQDTWLAALERWPVQGIPDNPGAWLMTTARNRAIDVLRQHRRVAQQHAQWGEELHPAALPAPDDSQALEDDIGDDLLRLMFVACHPVLPADARVALSLRLLGGLTTTEIARAFLQPEPTIAQRIVRAKRTLAQKQIPYEVPRADALPERLASVLEAIYLVFNEGYAASAGDDWMRPALCAEALRLARILAHRMPVPPVLGLLALMELQASRAAARVDAQGAPILLDQQNRARWDWLQIERGQQALARAVSAGGGDDPYVLQARIAFCHASARRAEDTDWARIAALYAQLLQVMPSPVVALNRVVAVSRSEGAFAAWALLQPLLDEPRLQGYAPLMVVRGELLQQLGREQDARDAFASAAALSQNQAERTLLRQRAGLPQEN
ncbi:MULTISPECIES: RNA polymerase sigma factor [Stenotrophomonas]|jgi:RNA polymerase sigma factor (sigma-70 family)|uniref:RNA polymerase sigma factor n=1 Tax=Stenotrophomonas TaxID=40323 RepID=UPI0003EA74F8|nr:MULTISPECIES: RNA polymerase sigma factor [Stenotrophomonas]EVT71012.1 RNA polymerase subunit sigma-24 [Stenotrophomonas maltophilia 5BA-I-2]OJH78228.1 MAG: RNA polymerase subunit sigma-24 [Stenotrophomonas maltophilia]EZP44197.1 RNA polymerase subunit sigma-24 [Stenotrophomonas sp. RIT309]MCK6232773.1 RNA polymerase sigma factor [Stenotrophomonas indicatrix]QBR42949.1 sigma-70 region 2 [Stenotrophomonas indicatrix]